MPHYQAKVSAEGQLTIPAAIREYFGLKTGDIVDFYVDNGERSVRLLARNRAFLSGWMSSAPAVAQWPAGDSGGDG